MPETLIVWLLGGLALLATGLAYLVRGGQWWARIFDFPRLQVAACGTVAVTASPFVDRSLAPAPLVALIAAAVVWQIARMWPYTAGHRKQSLDARTPAPERRIRILIANVWMPNRNAPALLARIRDTQPDIIIALETDAWWMEALSEIERIYPHVLRRPQDDTYGLMFYSRLELVDPEIRCIVTDHVPSVRTRVRLPGGDQIALYALHPEPPDIFQDTWERDAELLMTAREVAESGTPCIVAGDLNDVAWSRTTRLFQRISGLVDPRVGRGFFHSYHAKIALLRWPLDQLFHSPSLRLVELRRLRAFGSDHFPILVDLSFEPEIASAEPAPDERDGDREAADERIAQGMR